MQRKFDPSTARITRRRTVPSYASHRSYGREQVYDSNSNQWIWWYLLVNNGQSSCVPNYSMLDTVSFSSQEPVASGGGGDFGGAGASSFWESSPSYSSSDSYSSSSSDSSSSSYDSGSSSSSSSD